MGDTGKEQQPAQEIERISYRNLATFPLRASTIHWTKRLYAIQSTIGHSSSNPIHHCIAAAW